MEVDNESESTPSTVLAHRRPFDYAFISRRTRHPRRNCRTELTYKTDQPLSFSPADLTRRVVTEPEPGMKHALANAVILVGKRPIIATTLHPFQEDYA